MDKQLTLNRTILISLTGSRLYGIHTDDSDYDYKGICIATKPYYLGYSSFDQMDKGWEHTQSPFDYLGRDTVIYEIRRYFKLAADNNPSIFDVLYSDSYPFITKFGQKIIENRDLFLSKKSKFTFGGYAAQQLKKIESHRKWLLDPPAKKPEPEDFGIKDDPSLIKTELNSFLNYLYHLIRKRIEFAEEAELLKSELTTMLQSDIDFKQTLIDNPLPEECLEYTTSLLQTDFNFTDLMQKQHKYIKAKERWDSYQSWKSNRNEERAKLEAKCGYDSKHAVHLIRLLRMGCEILEGKGVLVDRRIAGDSEELKYIRAGNIKYDDLLDLVSKEETKLNNLYETSTLQKSAQYDKIEELLIELVEEYGL